MRPPHPHKVLVGISSCLLGAPVRYDGKHKRDERIHRFFTDRIQFAPVCPEVGIGMSTPRPPIQLVATTADTRVQGVTDRTLDVTLALEQYAQQQATRYRRLCGYIFKSRSPSCGLDNVPVFTPDGTAMPGFRRGKYADHFIKQRPSLPVCDERLLQTLQGCEQFLQKIYAYSDQIYQD